MYLVHSLPLATATPSSTSSSLLFHPTQQQKNQTKRFEVFLQPLLPHVFFFGGGVNYYQHIKSIMLSISETY